MFTGIRFIFFVLFLTAVSESASSSKEDCIQNTKGKVVTSGDKTRKLEIEDTFQFCFVHIFIRFILVIVNMLLLEFFKIHRRCL